MLRRSPGTDLGETVEREVRTAGPFLRKAGVTAPC